jgi:hypothetical protein
MQAFAAEQFTPTKWDDGHTKARFARQFVKFVVSDFDERLFSQTFYRRLSMTFGHIAHFNRQGFFETFFTTTADKVRFLRMTLAHACFGDPAFTYSDVERALQGWLRESEIVAKYEQRFAEEMEAGERADLARLKAKYEPSALMDQ